MVCVWCVWCMCGVCVSLFLKRVKPTDNRLSPEFLTFRLLLPAPNFSPLLSISSKYVVYDVTSLLATGPNASGVLLGNGWWGQGLGGSPQLRFVLTLRFANGSGACGLFFFCLLQSLRFFCILHLSVPLLPFRFLHNNPRLCFCLFLFRFPSRFHTLRSLTVFGQHCGVRSELARPPESDHLRLDLQRRDLRRPPRNPRCGDLSPI